MAFLTTEKLFSRKWFRAVFLILSGTLVMALGYVFFISPYKIVPGGVYGIAIILHYAFNFPIGITALCFDIPLILIGLKILGPRFGWKTILGFVSMAIFVDGITWCNMYFRGGSNLPLVENSPLLSSIYGGVLIGIGLGLVFKSKASSGGTDLIAMIIHRYTHVSLGNLIIYVDSVIVLVGFAYFREWEIPLYSWIVIYITGKVVDLILEGANYNKAMFIISEKYPEIKEKIIVDLERSGTVIDGKGMYSDDYRKIIFSIVTRREVEILKEYIYEIDKKAFISIMDTNEILGEGFKPLADVKKT